MMRISEGAAERARRVRLVATDVDGVLTDGSITMSGIGEVKSFSVKDGMSVTVARYAGMHVAIISGRASAIVEQRARDLKIDSVTLACGDKADALRVACQAHGLTPAEAAFLGDDWNDLPAFRLAAVSVAPSDAAREVREQADIVTDAAGGHGVLREFMEWLLDQQEGWAATCERWLASLSEGETENRQ